jgi:hypothetical protein
MSGQQVGRLLRGEAGRHARVYIGKPRLIRPMYLLGWRGDQVRTHGATSLFEL